MNSAKELSKRIVDCLSKKSYRPLKRKQLALLLGITEDEYPEFKTTLKQLLSDGRVIRGRGNKYLLAGRSRAIVGLLTVRGTNYGFVKRGKGLGIIEIRKGGFGGAMQGDLVEVEIIEHSRCGSAQEGRVVNIVRTGKRQAVGTAVETRFGLYFIPLRGGVFPEVPLDEGKYKLVHGDLMTVEFLRDRAGQYRSRAIMKLGDGSDYSSTIDAVLTAFEIPVEISREAVVCAGETQNLSISFDDREDYRGLYTLTIDPPDAKDFDDALSIERLPNGYRLYVHIADVSAVVPRASVLDDDASKRGTSVYLPGFVVPMLPYQLSNGVCCLAPDSERRTKTVIIEYDDEGKRKNYSVVRSGICSDCRLDYETVQSFLFGEMESLGDIRADAAIRMLWKLASMLREERMNSGSIILDMPEVRVEVDPHGKPLKLTREIGTESHFLVEECMLAANCAIAELMLKNNIPAIFRVHDEPEADALESLKAMLRLFAVTVSKGQLRRADIGDIIEAVDGKPFGRVINLSILRSMKMAAYSEEVSEHYALAFKKYLHFTSPIRRYPDLFVHQQLDMYYFKSSPITGDVLVSDVALAASDKERNAQECERNLIQLKILEYLARYKGKEFDAVITGLKDFGVVVELTEFLLSAFIHIRDIGEEYFIVTDNGTKLVGQGGTVFRPGQSVKVRLKNVDIPRRRLELRFAGFPDKFEGESYSVFGVRGKKFKEKKKKARNHTKPKRHSRRRRR